MKMWKQRSSGGEFSDIFGIGFTFFKHVNNNIVDT